MQLENILWRIEDGVGIATMNRPKALNALDTRTVRELGEMLSEVEADRTLRALILTGGGEKAFVAGADIAEMSKLTPLEARRFAEAGQRTFERLEALPIPTIAAVNGFALGGGLRARHGLRPRLREREGPLRPARGEPGDHPGLRGHPAAAAPGRSGPRHGDDPHRRHGRRGHRQGLGARPRGPASREARSSTRWARPARSPPRGRGPPPPRSASCAPRPQPQLAAGQEMEAVAFGMLFGTADGKEGLQAFVEKRPARFQGA